MSGARTLALVLAAGLAWAPAAGAQPGAETGAAPAAEPHAVPATGPRHLSPQQLRALGELERDFERYREAAEDHHTRMRAVLVREFENRLAQLEGRYAERIAATEAEQRRKQLEAMALLEKFIEDHPNHEQFTPDAMFRLADLHLDLAEYELEKREEEGILDALADYSASLALWQQILERFPRYRQLAGVLYLMAYYGQSQDERRSLLLYLALVCSNQYHWTDEPPEPLSREEVRERLDQRDLVNPYADCQPVEGADDELVRHAWVRGVGDAHFATPGELDEAIAAYRKVTADRETRLYPEALYKLSWSYYRRDYLLEAIRGFDESVRMYDETIARGERPALELREESLQYIAVSFTDPWPGELETDPVLALERAREFYKGRESEKHVRDVWVVLGRAFMDLQSHDQAIDSLYTAIGQPWHLHPDNPVIHQDIVNVYEAKGDKFGADAAAAQLATRYGPGTEWAKANETDRRAMENQRRIGERMLYAAARNTHDSATTAREEYEAGGSRDPALESEYKEHYDRAIALYQSFLDQFPESEHTYEINFNLAEAYFWSGQYLEAADQYRWVRDARSLSEARFASAALGVIQSYEAAIALRVDAGELSPIAVPSAEELRSLPQPVRPRTIPELYLALQTAWDEYQQLITDPRTAPQMALNAALVSVSYHHLDDAIRRFDVVMTRFCGSEQATRAKDGILAIYDARGDEDAFRELNQRFITSKCGDAQAIELARAQNRSLEFRRAEEAFAARNYEEAARLFYVYYKSAPADDDDLPTALFNSAVAYKQADKPKTALHLFKEFTDNKTEPFRKSGYFTEALRLQAVSHQSQYDYRAAVAAYLQLVDVARNAARDNLTPPPPLPGEPPRTFEEIRLDAMYNAAVMYELNRDFRNAVELYRRYETQEPDRRRKDRALWAVARTYRTANDIANLNRTYAEWRKKYGRDAGNENDFVFTFYDSARAFARIGRTADADRFRRQTIDAWKTVGSPTNTVAARMAGEYDLLFAERQFSSKFEPYRITTTARTEAQAKSLREGLDRVTKETQDRYRALADYGVPEYAMAAKVRIGQTLVLYASKLFAMPTPRYILDLDRRYPDQDVLMKYEENLSTSLAPLAHEARKEWVEVLQLARQRNVSNDWTRLALENLNREFPDEFPILHQELVEGTEEP